MTRYSSIRLLLAVALGASASAAQKPRARDLGVPFDGTPGPLNSITDITGLEVGYTTLIRGEGARVIGQGPVRTGVTAILPRGRAALEAVFAAFYAGNGNGDMTGTHWIEETGVLETPVMITNTLSVGTVRDATVDWMVKRNAPGPFWYPVTTETSDGGLNDMKGLHVKPEHAFQALENAKPGAIAEGNVGGGTGMNCNGFKGGTGTSSRVLSAAQGGFVVGVLVQCNYGQRSQLRIAGIPVGREVVGLDPCVGKQLSPPIVANDGRPIPLCGTTPRPEEKPAEDPEQGSIIVIVATNAPMSPDQLKRIARRVTLGLGRLGASNGNGSGDIFLAFSTANRGVDQGNSGRGGGGQPSAMQRVTAGMMDPFFTATIEATEEAVVNAMVAAENMDGADYRRSWALPHDQLQAILKKYNRLNKP